MRRATLRRYRVRLRAVLFWVVMRGRSNLPGNSEIQSLRKAVLAAVFVLSGAIVGKELEENELPSDRLDSLIAGIAAGGDDEEEFEVDESTLDIVIANFQDALATLGVDDGIIASMFGGDAEADEAIEAAAEIVESNKPSDDDMDELFDLFVNGNENLDIEEE